MSRWLALPVLALLAAGPANAAVLFTQSGTWDPGSGTAALSGTSDLPAFTNAGSIWVSLDRGSFDGGQWTIEGQLAKLWWDTTGEVDENGDPVRYLTGNEYIYSPACVFSAADPGCTAGNLGVALLGPRLLRVDWAPPAGFDNCYPFPGFNIDCAESYRFFYAAYDLQAQSGRPVSFAFHDTAPVPEPASWALLIAGFGLTGAVLRRRRQASSRA